MNLWHIAWNYLWNRKLTTSLTIVSVALGVALIYAVLTLYDETKKRFTEEGQAYDMVVGGKDGSPLQLVLSAVYFMDKPTGNIHYADYEWLRNHEDVAEAYPVMLGDTYRGFRIVGTVPEFFDQTWISSAARGTMRKPFKVGRGRCFERSMEAVLGSLVAEQTGRKVGDTFVGTHGFIEGLGHKHHEFPYTVVGILEPSSSPMDRVVFCDLTSVWEIHADHDHAEDEASKTEHHGNEENGHGGDNHIAESNQDETSDHEGEQDEDEDLEVTAVLVRLKMPGARFGFKDEANTELNAMTAIPAQEVAKLYRQFLAPLQTVLLAVGFLVVVISGLSIMIGLYLSIIQRKRDMAIMRALGASAYEILGSVLIEAFWVTLLGIGAGYLIGCGVSECIGLALTKRYGLTIGVVAVNVKELTAFSAIALVGIVAGIVPAWQAYRTDVARDLAEL